MKKRRIAIEMNMMNRVEAERKEKEKQKKRERERDKRSMLCTISHALG